jgi:dienelactone hydrolase
VPARATRRGAEVIATEERDGAIVRDLRIPDGRPDGPIEAYLVESSAAFGGPRAGLLFAHWYDTHAPNGNRTEFLDEAVDWAHERGASSILPQLIFPWAHDPEGSARDVASIRGEVARLRRCLETLAAAPAVDSGRLGVVGHDFGAMHALLLGGADPRPGAYAVMAAVPRWGDWFLPFWAIDEDRLDYLRALRPLDPIEQVAKVAPARVLFQFGTRDWYVAPIAGFEFRRAAGEIATVRTYEAGHDMRSAEAVADRTAFLVEALAG